MKEEIKPTGDGARSEIHEQGHTPTLETQVRQMLEREAYHYCADCHTHCRQTILAVEAVKEMAAENERLLAVMESRLDKETILRHLNYSEGGALTISASPPEFVRRYLAQLFAIGLEDAENFQTGSFQWRAEDYEMTIRRISGKSTAEVLGELRAENAQLKERLSAVDSQ